MNDDLYARADAKLQEAMRLLNDVRWIISEAMPPKPSSRPFCGHCDMTHMDGGTCHASDAVDVGAIAHQLGVKPTELSQNESSHMGARKHYWQNPDFGGDDEDSQDDNNG